MLLFWELQPIQYARIGKQQYQTVHFSSVLRLTKPLLACQLLSVCFPCMPDSFVFIISLWHPLSSFAANQGLQMIFEHFDYLILTMLIHSCPGASNWNIWYPLQVIALAPFAFSMGMQRASHRADQWHVWQSREFSTHFL